MNVIRQEWSLLVQELRTFSKQLRDMDNMSDIADTLEAILRGE